MRGAAPMVFLVDDEPPVLQAISRLLRAAGMKTSVSDSAADFLDRVDGATRGCLVLDIAMPGLSGMQVQEALAARGSRMPIIFLTGRADVPMTVLAMKRGAADFLTKPVDEAALIGAVLRALERDGLARRQDAEVLEIHSRLATLTAREREVMVHVVSGLLNKQVAAKLGTTEKTIKVHRARVMAKMGAGSLAGLVQMAVRVRDG